MLFQKSIDQLGHSIVLPLDYGDRKIIVGELNICLLGFQYVEIGINDAMAQ